MMDIHPVFQRSLRRLLGQRRDSLDAATAFGAGPTRAVEEEAAELPL